MTGLIMKLVALGIALFAARAQAQWPQWGGPNRNFKSDATGLADKWPDAGPKRLWTRPLGTGYSAISVDDGRLYTMYRKDDNELVVALDAKTGKTVWEHQSAVTISKKVKITFGKGPNATPLIHDGRVYTVGMMGHMLCLDKKTGKEIWTHDLIKDSGASAPEWGFASSPVIYKNTLIMGASGLGTGALAFDLLTGKVLWKRHDFLDIYASPILIKVGGEQQVVLFTDNEIVGLDPANGDIKWRYGHKNIKRLNITTPVWGRDGLLFVTSWQDGGARTLKLLRKGDKTDVKEAWFSYEMGVFQGNVVRVGRWVYGCGGNEKAPYFTTMNVLTGRRGWREEGFFNGTLVYADGKLIVLDEDGMLYLIKASPKEFKILSMAQVLKNTAWTVPTLVGKTLYLRDNVSITALDLS